MKKIIIERENEIEVWERQETEGGDTWKMSVLPVIKEIKKDDKNPSHGK
jgi:hypothetical protein